jgi:hypothetical protein
VAQIQRPAARVPDHADPDSDGELILLQIMACMTRHDQIFQPLQLKLSISRERNHPSLPVPGSGIYQAATL